MTDCRLILVGPNDALCDRCFARGIDVVVVDHPRRADPAVLRAVPTSLLLDYEHARLLEPVLAAAHAATPFAAALSLTELGLVPAARINDRLGLAGLPEATVQRTRDKAAMRRHLEQAGFPSVPAAMAAGPDDVDAFAERHGWPVVLKPRDGRASLGLRIVREPGDRDWRSSWPTDGLLMEAFLDGPEYSVETFSFDGRTVVVAMTEKLLAGPGAANPTVEMGNAIPARLDAKKARRIGAFVTDFLTTIGITDGIAHTEVKLTETGPAVIETHNRNGGDRIVDLVRLATEVDLLDWAVAWRTGAMPAALGLIAAKRGAAIRYLAPPPGTVQRVHGLAAARTRPHVVAAEVTVGAGDRVGALHASSDRVGYVLATGDTTADAIAHCEAARDTIEIVVEPG